jgi:hypothetical protein
VLLAFHRDSGYGWYGRTDIEKRADGVDENRKYVNA